LGKDGSENDIGKCYYYGDRLNLISCIHQRRILINHLVHRISEILTVSYQCK
jgi:hypothetical protein